MVVQGLKSILCRATEKLRVAGIETPGLDARVLLEAAVDKKTSYIFAHPEAPMTNAEYSRFRRYIRRRKKSEPVAYILGHKEFYGLDFIVNKNVLIPRPETELLVEEALEFIEQHQIVISNRVRNLQLHEVEDFSPRPSTVSARSGQSNCRQMARNDYTNNFHVIDVGTGSGCIIISLARSSGHGWSLPHTTTIRGLPEDDKGREVKFYATDISRKALTVAKRNAKRLLFEAESQELSQINSSRSRSNNIIHFFQSDLFTNPRLPKKFDLIIANLPYVPRRQTTDDRRRKTESIRYEPRGAIFADNNGAGTVKRFLIQAPARINKGGMILVELDPRNAKALYQFAQKQFPTANIELKKDLAKLDRYLKILS